MSTRVIQILPRLPPAICGVADYSFQIGERLKSTGSCEVFYVATSQDSGSSPEARRVYLQRRTSLDLVRVLEELYLPGRTVLILQFSGYSMARWGLCYWLIRSLKRFLARYRDVRLMTMFHELWASGSLTSIAGWTMPLQRGIVRSLVRLSSEVRTNRAEYGNMIRRLCPDYVGRICVQPVFSNFGELECLPVWSSRKHQIVAFQPPSLGTLAGENYWHAWRKFVDRVSPEKTLVAGRIGIVPSHPSIELLGMVSASAASRLLLTSRFAFTQYYDGYLGKSGIMAAIAAHGLVCVMPAKNHSEADGIYYHTHYLLPDDTIFERESDLGIIGKSLHDWYVPHNLNATANSYIDSIGRLRT